MMTDKDVAIRREVKHLIEKGKPAYIIKKPEFQVLISAEILEALQKLSHLDKVSTYDQIIMRLIRHYNHRNYHSRTKEA